MAKERLQSYPVPTQRIDTHLLQSALLKSGVSFTGAHQLITGLPVTSPDDRALLIGLLSELLHGGDSSDICHKHVADVKWQPLGTVRAASRNMASRVMR
jgi:hypothetical protein